MASPINQSNIHSFFATGKPAAAVAQDGNGARHRPLPFLLLCAGATVSGAGPVSLTPRAAWRPAARALNVFKIEYRASVNAANQSYIENAGGVENVLIEMWQTLPDHKRNAYGEFVRKSASRDLLTPSPQADPKAQARRLEQEKEKAAKEQQREAERKQIWERRDQEKERKDRERELAKQRDLFKNHLKDRKEKVDDLQLLMEGVVNDDAGCAALGLRKACLALAPPETSAEVGLPPQTYGDAIFVTNALERLRTFEAELPHITLEQVISIIRNLPSEGEGEGSDSEVTDDKDVVAARNTLHVQLLLPLVLTKMATEDGRKALLAADVQSEGVVDAHSWQEVLRRYIDFNTRSDSEEILRFPTVEGARRVGDKLTHCSYNSLSAEDRATLLVFMCEEMLETFDMKQSVDEGTQRIEALKKERRESERAEKAQAEIARQVEAQKRLEEQREAWPLWLTKNSMDPNTNRDLHPQQWKTFVQDFAAQKAREVEMGSEEESEDEEPQRTGSSDSDSVVVTLENEEDMSRGEYLRMMRAKREADREAKEQAQRAQELRREKQLAAREARRAEREEQRAKEASKREKDLQYEEELRSLAPRLVSLGYDRYYNRYWYFSCLADKIFVENSAVPTEMLPTQLIKYRECDSADTEQKRQAAIDDTHEGLRQVASGTLQQILTALGVEWMRELADPDAPEALVQTILKHSQSALCSQSYLSMLVHTQRTDHTPTDELSSESEDDDDDMEEGGGAQHRSKRAKTAAAQLELKSPVDGTWGYYDTKEQLDELRDFLNVQGKREGPLKAELDKVYEKVVAAMTASTDQAANRRSRRRKSFSRTKSADRTATSVLMDTLNTFVATTKENRSEMDEVKSEVRQSIVWQDFIPPAVKISEMLGSITKRVTKDEKEVRSYAEYSVLPRAPSWTQWLRHWTSFVSNVQSESALLFALYALRQRAYSTLPEARRNARFRSSNSPAKPKMREESEEEDEMDEGEEGQSWSAQLRTAAKGGKLIAMSRLLEDEERMTNADEPVRPTSAAPFDCSSVGCSVAAFPCRMKMARPR